MLPPARREVSFLLQQNRAEARVTTKSNLDTHPIAGRTMPAKLERPSGGLGQFAFGGAFLAIEDMVGGGEELINGLAVVGIDGYSGTYGDGWLVAVGAEPLGNAIGNPKGGSGFRFRKHKHEFVPSVTRSGVNGAAMNPKNVSQAADGFASHQMAVSVIDLFQAVHIEEHDGKRARGAFVALDFGVEGVEKPPVVGEPGERIGDGQMMHAFVSTLVFGNFGGESHGGDGHDADEGLQQEQRSVLRFAGKGAKAVRGAPGGDRGQEGNGGGGIAAAEAKCGPDQKRNAKELKGIVFQRGVKTAAEDDPAGERQSRKQEGQFNELLVSPAQAGILPPEENQGSDNHGADRVAQPPSGPHGAIYVPVCEFGQGQGGDADGGADRGANDGGKEREFENVLRVFKDTATSGKAIDQVAADEAFECVSDGDAERGDESAGGGEVDEESSGKDGGPSSVAVDQEGGECDAGARPDGSGAGVDVGQSEAELPGDEVHGGQDHQGG